MMACALVAALALLPVSSALSGSEPVFSMMGLEDEGLGRVWQDNAFFERMERRTGIRFSFEQFNDRASYDERLNGLRAGADDLPQVLFKAGLSPIQARELLDRGVLADLSPHIGEHMPNLSALMLRRPEIRRAITLPGGVIPALPYVEEVPAQNILWINRAWLDALGLPLPEDAEALEATLRAFRDSDPNRNGRADEIPLTFNGAYDLKYLAQAWGLAANDFNIFTRDGEVRFLAMEEDFRGFVAWCANLYAEGLIDKNAFTTPDTVKKVTDAKAANRYGAFFAPLPTFLVPLEWVNQYQALPPLNYQGRAAVRAVASPVYFGAFALTSACTDIPGMLSWVDTLYSVEGSLLAAVGLEGEDYVFDGDGTWRFTRDTPDSAYYAEALISTGHAAPGLSVHTFQQSFSDPMVRGLATQTAQVAARSVQPFPDLPLDRARADSLGPLQSALGRYVDESIARFVTGEWETTAGQFSLFENGLRERGLSGFLRVWQEIYDEGAKNDGL